MTVQNPDTKSNNDTSNSTEETEDKALDIARKIESGDMKFDEIEDDSLAKEIHERFIIQAEGIPEPGDIEKPDTDKPEQSLKTDQNIEPDLEPKKEVEPDFLVKRKSELDELNRITQKIDAGKKKLGELDEMSRKPERKKFEDVTSEESIQHLIKRQDQLDTDNQKVLTSQRETLEQDHKELQQDKLFMEISNFQHENTSFKTSKPIKVINSQYQKFVNDLGEGLTEKSDKLARVDKFLKDKDYRDSMEAKGFNFPISSDDYKKFDQISKINAYKTSGKYPSFGSANHDYKMENGIVLDEIKQTALDTEKAILEKIEKGSGVTTLSPDDGSVGNSKTEMSQAEMQAWIINHPNPSTPQEEKMQKAIHTQLTSGGG